MPVYYSNGNFVLGVFGIFSVPSLSKMSVCSQNIVILKLNMWFKGSKCTLNFDKTKFMQFAADSNIFL